jgi:hypothetical protein
MTRPRGNGQESGFALLMVFVLAAIIAVSLYFEVPRIMFERTREREQLLIDRGEQYSLAVRRFYVKFGRWPVSMDELENTNNIRFLRRQYKDPMTGKADWRIIHETAGVLTDSLVHPANPLGNGQSGATGGTGSSQTFGTLTSSQPFGTPLSSSDSSASADQPAPKALGLLFRPSDRGPLGTAHGGVSADDSDAQSSSSAGNEPGPGPAYPDAGAPAQEPSPTAGASNGNPAAPDPNAMVNPNQPAAGLAGATGGTGSVAQQIMGSLMAPRQSPTAAAPGQNQSITGGGIGIAGVASSSPLQGIKRYKDKSKYKEWEFVFDMTSLQQLQNPQQAQPQQQQQPGQAQQPGTGFGGGTASPSSTSPTSTGP